MKRLEFVTDRQLFEHFSAIADSLTLAEFEAIELRNAQHSSERKRPYRGLEFAVDLLDRLKVGVTLSSHREPYYLERTSKISLINELILRLSLFQSNVILAKRYSCWRTT
jgi:hypothetical protein